MRCARYVVWRLMNNRPLKNYSVRKVYFNITRIVVSINCVWLLLLLSVTLSTKHHSFIQLCALRHRPPNGHHKHQSSTIVLCEKRPYTILQSVEWVTMRTLPPPPPLPVPLMSFISFGSAPHTFWICFPKEAKNSDARRWRLTGEVPYTSFGSFVLGCLLTLVHLKRYTASISANRMPNAEPRFPLSVFLLSSFLTLWKTVSMNVVHSITLAFCA